MRLHQDAVVVDLHCDSLLAHVDGRRDITRRSDHGHLDVPRMREGGVTAQVFAVFPHPTRYPPRQRKPRVLDAIRTFYRICRSPRSGIRIALEPDDIPGIAAFGRIAGVLGIEGGHALEDDIINLDRFYRRGVRVLTLTWNNSNPLARSCMSRDGKRRGLTRLGREAVRRMNRLGMVIDLSHASERTFFDVLETSTAPVICSHSACAALRRFPRNLTDRQLRALGQSRGVVGIVFLPYFISREYRKVTLEHVLDHIEHAAATAGVGSVAIGSDFDGFTDPPPRGLEDVSRLPALTDGLRRRGFSVAETQKILGLNFLRAWREAGWKRPAPRPR